MMNAGSSSKVCATFIKENKNSHYSFPDNLFLSSIHTHVFLQVKVQNHICIQKFPELLFEFLDSLIFNCQGIYFYFIVITIASRLFKKSTTWSTLKPVWNFWKVLWSHCVALPFQLAMPMALVTRVTIVFGSPCALYCMSTFFLSACAARTQKMTMIF